MPIRYSATDKAFKGNYRKEFRALRVKGVARADARKQALAIAYNAQQEAKKQRRNHVKRRIGGNR